MEVRSNKPNASPEERAASSKLELTRRSRDGVLPAADRAEAGTEARKRELQAEVERASHAREVAARVGEVVRDKMLPRVAAADRLELSEAGLAAVDQVESEEGAHAAHVAALKAALEAGELFSRERLERAADRLLGAELEV